MENGTVISGFQSCSVKLKYFPYMVQTIMLAFQSSLVFGSTITIFNCFHYFVFRWTYSNLLE